MTGFEIAILFIIVYWLFGPRVIAMVDVLSTRVQAVYETWNRHAYSQPPDLSNLPSVQRQVAILRRKRELGQVQGRDVHLEGMKARPWTGFPQKIRNPVRGPCTSCDENIQTRACADNPNDDEVVNVLEIKETTSPSFLVRRFSDLVHNYKVPNYNFAKIKDTVVTDERVQDAITETVSTVLSEAEGEVTENAYAMLTAKYSRKAKGVIKYMHAAMSNLMLKITSYVMYKLLPHCVTSVCVHPAQVEMVKKASQAQVPIVYVPLHRSHLDYILVIFTLLNSGIRPPLTAAGINLNMPIFGILLRWLGAFYIKRRIEPAAGGKDLIYRAALHTYMVQCLKAGHNIKFYIEGGRTRTGKPLLPKVGLLSVIVDAFMDGTVDDVLLVPVSVNYDRLVDGNFVRESLGQPKQKETTGAALWAIWQTLKTSHGSCAINFNQPYSLKELVKSFQSDRTRTVMPLENNGLPTLRTKGSFSSLHGTDVVSEDHRHLVEHIANHLVYDGTEASAVMSTNVVSWLLLTQFREGVRMGALVHQLDQLRSDLINERRHLGFTGASVDVINSALSLLGPELVKREKQDGASEWDELITPVTDLPNVIELSYYSNALLPHYALPSIIATSAFALMQSDPEAKVSSLVLREPDLKKHSQELCEILQFEFVFHRPCQQQDEVLCQTLNNIAIRGTLTPIRTNIDRRDDYSFANDDDEDTEGPTSFYKVSSTEEAAEDLRNLTMALRPLLDTYIATAKTLYWIVDRQVIEGDFVKEVLKEIKNYLQTGSCLYGESCSVDPIRNACKWLQKWEVIKSFRQDSIRLFRLSDQYNSRPALDALVKRVSIYKYNDLSSS